MLVPRSWRSTRRRPVDAEKVKHQVLRGDPFGLLEALAGAPVAGQGQWRARWERVEVAAQGAIDKTLDNDPLSAGGRATEPGVLRRLLAALDAAHTMVVAPSMPLRDLEWFGAPRANPPRVLANRGANGIDGVTSTALGVAAGAGGPVVAVLGDLAFLHDVSALVPVGHVTGSCTLVVLDNGGGGSSASSHRPPPWPRSASSGCSGRPRASRSPRWPGASGSQSPTSRRWPRWTRRWGDSSGCRPAR